MSFNIVQYTSKNLLATGSRKICSGKRNVTIFHWEFSHISPKSPSAAQQANLISPFWEFKPGDLPLQSEAEQLVQTWTAGKSAGFFLWEVSQLSDYCVFPGESYAPKHGKENNFHNEVFWFNKFSKC